MRHDMDEQAKFKRRSRFARSPEAERPQMVLQERDTAIIRIVNDYQILLGEDIKALFFSSQSAAQYRLMRLFQHEFLDRHFLPVVSGGPASSPILYTVGKRGIAVLMQQEDIERRDIRYRSQIKWKFVEHQLAINKVRIAIELACRQPQYQLETWLTERVFKREPEQVKVATERGREQEKPILPDAYFCLHTPPGTAHFFLEVDRGTEPHHKFKPQVVVYEAYVASGQYQARFSERSLRILVVATTQTRLTNLQATTRKAGGDRKYCFATLCEITPESVLNAPIWQRLGEKNKEALIAF